MPQPTLHPFLRPGITLVWAKALGFAMIHGFALLMGVTLLLPPAPMLRALVEEEVSTFTFLGRSNVAVIICDSTKKGGFFWWWYNRQASLFGCLKGNMEEGRCWCFQCSNVVGPKDGFCRLCLLFTCLGPQQGLWMIWKLVLLKPLVSAEGNNNSDKRIGTAAHKTPDKCPRFCYMLYVHLYIYYNLRVSLPSHCFWYVSRPFSSLNQTVSSPISKVASHWSTREFVALLRGPSRWGFWILAGVSWAIAAQLWWWQVAAVIKGDVFKSSKQQKRCIELF